MNSDSAEWCKCTGKEDHIFIGKFDNEKTSLVQTPEDVSDPQRWMGGGRGAPCDRRIRIGRMRSCAAALLAALLCVGFVSGGNPDAKRLYDDLLSNYNKLVRPVVNVSEAVTVRLKLKLSQLIDVVSEAIDRSIDLASGRGRS